ncbi:hypothetical protein C8R45DRAFT_417383 [Mycena sanguinolenta]|nr:hypothetical protein C8R45DRAFT_417383 [Mycena sanguinolenta]
MYFNSSQGGFRSSAVSPRKVQPSPVAVTLGKILSSLHSAVGDAALQNEDTIPMGRGAWGRYRTKSSACLIRQPVEYGGTQIRAVSEQRLRIPRAIGWRGCSPDGTAVRAVEWKMARGSILVDREGSFVGGRKGREDGLQSAGLLRYSSCSRWWQLHDLEKSRTAISASQVPPYEKEGSRAPCDQRYFLFWMRTALHNGSFPVSPPRPAHIPQSATSLSCSVLLPLFAISALPKRCPVLPPPKPQRFARLSGGYSDTLLA